MSKILYHFTDSARLPYILAAEHLRPGKNLDAHFPCEFLWATEEAVGEPTANYSYGSAYRDGETYAVRFSLRDNGFFHWSEISKHVAGWTQAHNAMLLLAARGADTAKWWCRVADVPMADIVAVEGRTYRNKAWKVLDRQILGKMDQAGVWLGTQFGGTLFMSVQHKGRGPHGLDAYQVGKVEARLAA